MQNFVNSIRESNMTSLSRTGLKSFPKLYINNSIEKTFYYQSKVSLLKLSDEEIAKYTSNYKKKSLDKQIAKKTKYESNRKKAKLIKNDKDNLELALPEMSATGGELNPTSNDLKSSTRPTRKVPKKTNNIRKASFKHKNACNKQMHKIKVCDIRTIMDESKIQRFYEAFFPEKIANSTSGNSERKSSIFEIESLYNKYFNNSLKDNIIVLANIVNLILLFNKHNLQKKINWYDMSRNDKDLLDHITKVQQIDILENKIINILDVILPTIEKSNFKLVFTMIFVGLVTVLRGINQNIFKMGNIFKKNMLILWKCLQKNKSHKLEYIKLLKSKIFLPFVLEIISLIEEGKKKDQGLRERLDFYFSISGYGQECFQTIINSIETKNSNDDMVLLLDSAIREYYISRTSNNTYNSLVDLNCVNESNKIETFVQGPLNIEEPELGKMVNVTPNADVQPQNINNIRHIVIQPGVSNLNENYSGISNFSTPPPIVRNVQGLSSNVTLNFMGSSPESVFQIDNDTIILDNNQYRLVRTPISHVRVVPQSYIRVVQSAPNKSNLINGFVPTFYDS